MLLGEGEEEEVIEEWLSWGDCKEELGWLGGDEVSDVGMLGIKGTGGIALPAPVWPCIFCMA